MSKRWDGDERHRGIADARAFVPLVTELLETLEADEWVTEDAHAHLLPHIERELERLPLTIERAEQSADGAFELDLRWSGRPRDVGAMRAAIYALVGSVAEAATYVRQHGDARELRFDVVTGMLAADTPFAPHGHTLRLRVLDARG